MFLSYAVVPVFVFTVLLNFFYLYSPISSLQCGQNFTTCEDCLKSPCHIDKCRPCTLNQDTSCTYQCFTCDPDPAGNAQYYTETDCKTNCTDKTKTCVCDGACYMCIATQGTEMTDIVCAMPTQAVDEQCAIVPYGDCGTPDATGL